MKNTNLRKKVVNGVLAGLTAGSMMLAGCGQQEVQPTNTPTLEQRVEPSATAEPTATYTLEPSATPTQEPTPTPDIFEQSDYGVGMLTTYNDSIFRGDLEIFRNLEEGEILIPKENYCVFKFEVSPNNQRIAFLFTEPNEHNTCGFYHGPPAGVGLINTDGSNQEILINPDEYPTMTEDQLQDYHPQRWEIEWSPDGNRLAYFVAGDHRTCPPSECGEESEFIENRDMLFVINTEEGDVKKIYDEISEENFLGHAQLNWVDGQNKIIFQSPRKKAYDKGIVHLIDIDTMEMKVLLSREDSPEHISERDSLLTSSQNFVYFIHTEKIRDKSEDAFYFEDNKRSDLYRINLETGEEVPLTMGMDISSFDISPDNKYIAFSTDRSHIGIYNLEEGYYHTMMSQDLAHIWLVGWSPDGKEIAFLSDEPDTGIGFETLYRLDFETKELKIFYDESRVETAFQEAFWYER